MALLVYALCFATSAACAWLLLRGYSRTRVRLLLWSGLCFACMALNNLLLIIDRHLLPDVEMSMIRTAPSVIGISLLLFGLVWETRS